MKQDSIKKSVKLFQTKADSVSPDVFLYLHNMGEFLNKSIFSKELGCPLEKFVLAITHMNALGNYKIKNGIGFSNEISISPSSLTSKALMAAVLFHEMVHEYQELYDPRPTRTRAYHDVRFREVSKEYVPTDKKGQFIGITEKFAALIVSSGLVETEAIDLDLYCDGKDFERVFLKPKPDKKQPTKMKKWSCGCTNVRCAVALKAFCEKCGEKFTLQSSESG
jgi:hypothetical protein